MSSFIGDLKPGVQMQRVYAVKNKKLLPFRDGSGFFLALTLSDKTGQVGGRVWEQVEEVSNCCVVGDVVKVTGLVSEYNGVAQISLYSITACNDENIDMECFLPSTEVSVEFVWEEWLNITSSLKNPYLQSLLTVMVKDKGFVEGIAKAPASKRNHHSFLGGLWQHSRGLVAAAEGLARVYPQMDRDLLVTAALLHDLGKMEEYRCRATIDFDDAGSLSGHVVLGVGLVERYISQIPDFPEVLRKKLLHMIVIHHGEYEWQSLKRPEFLEAAILHQLDMLDAMVEMFTSAEGEGREM
ncbi:3'-5' exoribonuclease YhaM family protein [Desulforamulus aquiferis]|uniref:HD domain-containing protein n=1 Tax=Desulforamulus aquiferis TaxID=1397668 RepID=A0AAW7ZGB0_9FIRM|nr:HD domain-containing protein [Desulforamulus aquiferis]MDO7788293.1 HD domain-containing protein [Desulforamulus aquiferis]